MANLKECNKEFKKLLKSVNKIYKTRPVKFKENELNKLIEDSIKSLKVITSNEESIKLLKNKFMNNKSFSSINLLMNEEYFYELSKIIDFQNIDDENNIYLKAIINLMYTLSYNSILYPHIKNYIDTQLIDHNEVTNLQQKLINVFNYWEFLYKEDIKENKKIDKNINIDLLNSYFNFNNEIEIRNKKYQEEENKKIRKERLEKFKTEVLSLDKDIKIDEQYKLEKECNFLPCFEDFKTNFGNSRMVVDKSKNLGDYNDLIIKIAYQNNIYALTEYILLIITQDYKHVPVLDEVIKHMLTKVKYNLQTLEFQKIGTECSYAAFCEYLMYQFGIVFKKDVNKARYLLLKNAHLLKTPIIHKRPHLNKYILKAIFMHYKDYIHFEAYDYILNYILPDVHNFAVSGYDHETLRYVLEYAKEKNNIDFIGKLLNELEHEGINIFEDFAKEKAIYDNKIYEEEQKRLEIKRKEDEEKAAIEKEKEAEFHKRYELLNQRNSNPEIKELKSLSIEELSNMKGNKYAMYLVAKHYFDLGYKDKNNYLIAAEYYNNCSKLGLPYQYINVGISYGNYSSSSDDEYAKLEQDCYREKAKEYVNFAFCFILSKFKYNPIEDKEKEEIFNYYINNDEKTNYEKSLIKISYYLYKYEVGKAFEEYNLIKYDLKSLSLLGRIFSKILVILEERNFEKFTNLDNNALKNEIELVYKLGCKRIGLQIGLAYYNGNYNDFSLAESYSVVKNRIFDRDYKKAYSLLKDLNEEYGGNSKDYYQKIIDEIEKKM